MPSSITPAPPGDGDAGPCGGLAERVLSGPGLWLDWLEELDRQSLLEELLAGGVIARALEEAPHEHAYDRTLTAKMTVICVLVACLFRERRADGACAGRECGHRRCWVEEAQVTELTALLRSGRAGDQLAAWPATMRVFARRERPHPGAQLTLFEAADGWRYCLRVTNLPVRARDWRSQVAYIDAAHRVHARVEDRIRTGKDCGIGHFPSRSLDINTAWLTASLLAATLLAWLRHLALDGDLSKAEPKTLRYRILHTAARLVRGARRRQLRIPAAWPWASDITAARRRITALPQAP